MDRLKQPEIGQNWSKLTFPKKTNMSRMKADIANLQKASESMFNTKFTNSFNTRFTLKCMHDMVIAYS